MSAQQWLWLLPVVPVLSAAAADLAARRKWRLILAVATVGYSTATWFLILIVTALTGYDGPWEPFILALFVALLCWISLFMRWRPDKA